MTLTLAELQIEAIRGVLEELLTDSPTADPRQWSMHAIGEISRVLDMQNALEVMGFLTDQEARRGT